MTHIRSRRKTLDSPPQSLKRHRKVLHKSSTDNISPTNERDNGDKKGGTNGYHSHGRESGAPLRRGDACLMCRAKKLKCSAQKPVCDQCVKRKDRCVYDALRPASRVEKLQRRLEMEEEEDMRRAYEARRHSTGMFSFDISSSVTYPVTPMTAQDGGIPLFPAPWNYGLLGFHPSGSGTGPTPALSAHGLSPPPTGSSGHLTELHGTPPSGWPWTISSNDFSPTKQSLSSMLPVGLAADSSRESMIPNWSHFGLSSTCANGYDAPFPHNGHAGFIPTPLSSVKKELTPTPPSTTYPSPPLAIAEMLDFSTVNNTPDVTNGYHPAPSSFMLPTASAGVIDSKIPKREQNELHGIRLTSRVTEVVNSVMSQKQALDANALTASDMTEHARDYLLDLFFYPIPPRPQCGSEVLSEQQFRGKLALPQGQRPHPCLLFSMYTTASSHSYIPAIRKLSEPLFLITASKVDDAIKSNDRLLDVINALKNLSKWLFTQARVLEGYRFSCAATSLCVAAGLHKIPSSIIQSKDGSSTTRKDTTLLPPAETQGELCERIHAFWSAWGNERGGHNSHAWPSSIRDELISTPLPRAPEDYLTGAVRNEPDITLRSLYDLSHRKEDKALQSLYSYILASCHLAHRAMNLSSLPPESAAHSYRALSRDDKQTRVMSPRQDHPSAYEEIMETSLWLEENMPRDWRPDLNKMINGTFIEPDVPVIALCLKAARMHLHPVSGDVFDRQTAIRLAKECATLIRVWLRQLMGVCQAEQRVQARSSYSIMSALNGSGQHQNTLFRVATPSVAHQSTLGQGEHRGIGGSSRNVHGISGPYALSPTSWVVECLVRASSVLRDLGQVEDAESCTNEAQAIVDGFKSVGTTWVVLGKHVEELEQIMRS